MQEEYRAIIIEEILAQAKAQGASDIHLASGNNMMFRIHGTLVRQSENVLQSQEIENILKQLLSTEQIAEAEYAGTLDTSCTVSGFGRMRVSVFGKNGEYVLAIRILSEEIPDMQTLYIPNAVARFTDSTQGLVLVAGKSGSGKTTTVASLIAEIANRHEKKIITIENPVEYRYPHGKSMVFQMEPDGGKMSYAKALRAALRQDADVIMVGELADTETISLALSAAESGKLVFSLMHTGNAAASIERLVDVFPEYQRQQVRVQLSEVLLGIITQQLLKRQRVFGNEKMGRVPAFEVLLTNPAVRNIIREGKIYQLSSVLQSERKSGMQMMDDAIYDLYMKSFISSETAILYASDPQGMKQKVQLFS